MINFIGNEFKRIIYNCAEKYAQRSGSQVDEIQVLLGCNGDEVTYKIFKNYKFCEEYDIMQVLGVNFDVRGYSRLAPPFIYKSILSFSEMYDLPMDETVIMCCPYLQQIGRKEKKMVDLFLFHGEPPAGKYIEMTYEDGGEVKNGFSFDSLFSIENFEIPNT